LTLDWQENMNRHIILTRPAGKNASLQSLLAAAGYQVTELPAIERFPLSLRAGELPNLAAYHLVFFVSGYAVQVFFEMLAQHHRSWPAGLYAGAVGMATANVLQKLGVSASRIIHPAPNAENQDSEAFFDELLKIGLDKFNRVLVVRGQSGRQWLAEQLRAAKVQVDFLPVYERKPRVWTPSESKAMISLLQSSKPISWLLTSKESVDSIFDELKRYQLVQYCLRHHFLVTHPRIGARIQAHLKGGAFQENLPEKRVVINICQPSDESIFEMLTTS
jgi:uroporphyrinogen-III synthase